MTGSAKTFKGSNLAKPKPSWRDYPNNLCESVLAQKYANGKSKQRSDKFPNWYRWLHQGDRIKIQVLGNTPATLDQTYETYATIRLVTLNAIHLEVESWSGWGHYQLCLGRNSLEKILWQAAGTSSRVLSRMRRNEALQKLPMDF